MIHPRKLISLLAALCSMAAVSSSFCLPSTAADIQQTQNFSPATKPRIRVGLALGGGGARGAAEVGVLQVFKEEGIPIDIVAGTSIGAVVGGLYVAGVPLEKLAGEFEHATFMKEFMPMPLVVQLLFTPLVFGPRLFGIHPYDGLYEGKKMIGIADKLAGDDRNTVEKLPIPFAAVCTNLMTGRSHRITSGDLGIAMEASTAVPGIKRPVQIGDQLYCDGGLSCNLPVQHVREMGADFIIAVDIDENLKQVCLLYTSDAADE